MKQEKIEELASKAARKALAARPKIDDIIEDDDAFEEFSVGETPNIEEISEFDIFDFCENEFVKKGDFVEYTIKKNGATIGFKKHPFSWEKIQKEFGGGRYNVLAKSTLTGRIVKRQSMPVEDLQTDGRANNHGGFNPADLVQQIAEVVKPKDDGPNFMELFTLMQSQQEKARQEADRAADRARAESEKQTSTLVQLMQQNTLMMLEMMKATKKEDSTVQLAQLIQAFADKMENRFERTIDKIQAQQSSSKSEFGLLEVLKLQQDAQDKGFKLYSQLNSIAEAKAEEKLELIEEYRETGGGGSTEKKTMTDTLIETILPTVAGALAKQGQAQPQAARPKQVAQQRRAVSPRPTQQNPNAFGQRTQTSPVQAGGQVQAQRTQAPSSKVGTVGGTGIGQNNQSTKNSVGLPKANFPKVVEKTVSTPVNVPNTSDIEGFKKNVTDILVPIFTVNLLEQNEPSVAAAAVEAGLLDNGISKEEFLAKISLSDMMKVVQGFELPEEANPWFEEIYANLTPKPYNGVGEYTANV